MKRFSDTDCERQVDLAVQGYTVTSRAGVLTRIGNSYVLRSRNGYRLALPGTADRQALLAAWRSFAELSAPLRPMLPIQPLAIPPLHPWEPGFATVDGTPRSAISADHGQGR